MVLSNTFVKNVVIIEVKPTSIVGFGDDVVHVRNFTDPVCETKKMIQRKAYPLLMQFQDEKNRCRET